MIKLSQILVFYLVIIGLLPNSLLSKPIDTLRLDLALHDPGSIITISGNEEYDLIIIENIVGYFVYSMEIHKSQNLLPTLQFDPSQVQSDDERLMDCPDLAQEIKNLKTFQTGDNPEQKRDEKELGRLTSALKSELKDGNCRNPEILNTANYWLETTRKQYPQKIKIKTGDKVTIKVRRDSLEWTFVFNGEERGQWVTTYGFGFTSKGLESPSYHSKQIPDTSIFQILKSRKNEYIDLNYIPSVFFSYFPSQNFSRTWNHSLTAGLGFALSTTPVVFFGYNALYHHNIGLSAGIAFQQQNRLKSQYAENDILAITLDTDQLHDRIYRPNFFLAINFRFGESPFKSENE